MKKSLFKAGLVLYIILLLFTAIILPSLGEKIIYNDYSQNHIDVDLASKVANMKLFEIGKSDMFYIINLFNTNCKCIIV